MSEANYQAPGVYTDLAPTMTRFELSSRGMTDEQLEEVAKAPVGAGEQRLSSSLPDDYAPRVRRRRLFDSLV